MSFKTLHDKAQDYVFNHTWLLHALAYPMRAEQKIFEMIFRKHIENKTSCVFTMPDTIFGGRAFGKSTLILKLANTYHLPVYVYYVSRRELLQEECARMGYTVDVYDATAMYLSVCKPSDDKKVILVDEPATLGQIQTQFFDTNFIPIGFAHEDKTLHAKQPFGCYEIR